MADSSSVSRNDEGCGQPPPMVRAALLVLLGHVEPGWDNCKWVVQMWLDGKLNETPDGKLEETCDHDWRFDENAYEGDLSVPHGTRDYKVFVCKKCGEEENRA